MNTESNVELMHPAELRTRWDGAHAMHLVDVRSAGEFASEHVKGAVSIPVSEIGRTRLVSQLGAEAGISEPLVLACASGIRANQAAEILRTQGIRKLRILDGGPEAWKKQGLPINKTSRFLSLERQVQIALGALILLLVLKSALLHPLFLALLGALGIGLINAGVTANCGLASLLARMPWNRNTSCQTV